MKNKISKIFICLSLLLAICVLVSCSSDKSASSDKGGNSASGKNSKTEVYYTSDGQKVTIEGGEPETKPSTGKYLDKSPLAPTYKDKHIEPDLSKAKPRAASKSVADTSTEEKFIEALENFANPNGNHYDAMAILGSFNYTEDETELYDRFARASENWHSLVESMVGEKCIVDISFKSKGDISTTADKFAEWQSVHGGIGEDYTYVKCVIKHNYSSASVSFGMEIVKVDGKWHLANASVLDKLQSILIDELFR